MNLFDDIDRVQTGIVSNVYSGFVLLNGDGSSDSQCLRNRLESWFEKFPASSKKDVRERFRSTNPETHEGALFELFLHELMTRLDCSVDVHPEVAGSDNRPDFLVCHGGKRFYLEATTVGQRDGPFTPNNDEQDAIDKLSTLCSPNFNLRIEMIGTLSRTLRRKHLVPRFAELLARHDPDTVLKLIDTGGLDSAPSAKYEADGWSIEAWLLPISSRSRRNDQTRRITVMHRRAKRTNSVEPVRNAATKKSKKYGNPNPPGQRHPRLHPRAPRATGRRGGCQVSTSLKKWSWHRLPTQRGIRTETEEERGHISREYGFTEKAAKVTVKNESGDEIEVQNIRLMFTGTYGVPVLPDAPLSRSNPKLPATLDSRTAKSCYSDARDNDYVRSRPLR